VTRRLARAAPYAVLLALAGWLFLVAGQFEYTGPADRIGPGFWPKAVLALLAVLCAYEIAKSLRLGVSESVDGVLQSLMQEAAASLEPEAAQEQPSARRLGAGIGVTLGYVVLVDVLGFFLATAAFLAAFILVGGYRRPAIAAAVGIACAAAMTFVFMKIVYVSLPLGWGAFRSLSLALLWAFGVR
jgi:putative tricarboxylic transport membrane protein